MSFEYVFKSFFKLSLVYYFMNKKGQVTIFIIIAILLVVTGVLYFSFRDVVDERVGGFSGANSVEVFVEECFSQVSQEAVYVIGEGGGYFIGENFSTETGFSYHIYGDENYFPSLETMEEEISLYTAANLFSCINNFEDFSEFDIDDGKIDVSTKIFNDSVEVSLDFPVSVRKGEEVVRFQDFNKVVVPVRLGEMHFVLSELISQNYYSEKGICFSCFDDLAYEHDFVFENIVLENEDLFLLIDLENKKIEKPYLFVFVNRRPNEA